MGNSKNSSIVTLAFGEGRGEAKKEQFLEQPLLNTDFQFSWHFYLDRSFCTNVHSITKVLKSDRLPVSSGFENWCWRWITWKMFWKKPKRFEELKEVADTDCLDILCSAMDDKQF